MEPIKTYLELTSSKDVIFNISINVLSEYLTNVLVSRLLMVLAVSAEVSTTESSSGSSLNVMKL